MEIISNLFAFLFKSSFRGYFITFLILSGLHVISMGLFGALLSFIAYPITFSRWPDQLDTFSGDAIWPAILIAGQLSLLIIPVFGLIDMFYLRENTSSLIRIILGTICMYSFISIVWFLCFYFLANK